MDGVYKNERYLTLGRIVIEYKLLNNPYSALSALKRFENVYDKSIFTTTHEAEIRYMQGDTATSLQLLKSVIDKHLQYEPMNWFTKTFMQWINSGHEAEYNRFYNYFYGVFCQLKALYNYREINHDIEKKYDFFN